MNSYLRIKSVALFITLIFVFGFPTPALAQGIVYGDTVPSGTTVDQDIVLIGPNVTINGTVNGNVFILGNQVQINGDVNGSLVMIGQNISIQGGVSGGTYVLALTLELGSGAELDRDLYVLSVGLASEKDTIIQRDLFALGLDAGLYGSVGRDLNTSIGPLQLYNGLMTLIGFEELTIKLHFDLPQPVPENDEGSESSRENPAVRSRIRPAQPAARTALDWNAWILALVREWIIFLLFGFLAIWLVPQRLEQVKSPFLKHPLKTTGIGFIVLVVSINLFIVGLLIATLIFSIGLALNYLQLWQLSIALWIISYGLLALVLTILWLFIVYGTKIISIYIIFTWLFTRLNLPGWKGILAILIGALVYVLLRSIPMVGWVIGVLVTAIGMGTAWLGYHEIRNPKKQMRKSPRNKVA